MSERLYIIGNGFDRYHGAPSSYYDFRTYLTHHNVDIINMSVGIAQYQHFGRSFLGLWDVCSNAAKKGVTLVAARSNAGLPTIPADFPMVYSVSSLSGYKKDRRQSDYYTVGEVKFLLDSEKTSNT